MYSALAPIFHTGCCGDWASMRSWTQILRTYTCLDLKPTPNGHTPVRIMARTLRSFKTVVLYLTVIANSLQGTPFSTYQCQHINHNFTVNNATSVHSANCRHTYRWFSVMDCTLSKFGTIKCDPEWKMHEGSEWYALPLNWWRASHCFAHSSCMADTTRGHLGHLQTVTSSKTNNFTL